MRTPPKQIGKPFNSPKKTHSDLTNSIENIKKSTVKILASFQGSQGTGSGFIVSQKGHIITNYHVVTNQGMPADKVEILIASPNHRSHKKGRDISLVGNFIHIDCTVVDSDKEHDLAILLPDKDIFSFNNFEMIIIPGVDSRIQLSPCKINDAERIDGEAITISGYPLTNPVLISNSGYISSIYGYYKFDDTSNKIEAIYGDVQSNPGNSGGPVYLTKTGEVIGVLVGGQQSINTGGVIDAHYQPIPGVSILTDAGISIIIPVMYVKQILAKNKIII